MPTATKTTKEETKPRPVTSVRSGSVRIPIWQNHADNTTYYKAGEPELSYMGTDQKWHPARSWGPGDLINLMKAAALAHTELVQRNRSEPPSTESVPEPAA